MIGLRFAGRSPFLFLRPPLLAFIALTLAVLFAGQPVAAESADHEYLTELVKAFVNAHLPEDREWRLLLHYRENLFGSVTSEQDEVGFFYPRPGK